MFPRLKATVKPLVEIITRNPFAFDHVAVLGRVGEILESPDRKERGCYPDASDEQFLQSFFPGCQDEIRELRALPVRDSTRLWEEITEGAVYRA